MQTVTVKYIGDRPFFQANVDAVGRITFNRHNNFTKELPVEVCGSIVKQWGKFFEIGEMGEQRTVAVEEEKVEPVVVVEKQEQQIELNAAEAADITTVTPIECPPCPKKRPQGFTVFPPNTTKAERAVISAKLKKSRDARKLAAKKKKATAIRLEKTGKERTLKSRQIMAKKMKAARAETTWISRGPNKGTKYDRASVLAARYAAYFQSAPN